MVKLLGLLFIGCTLISCSKKPSDSDIGRAQDKDGFKVKSFVTATCTNLDTNIKNVLRAVLKNQSITKQETTTIGNTETAIYLSSDENKMMKITKYKRRVSEVLIEGDGTFITPIMQKINKPEKFIIRNLINAKKTYINHMSEVKSIVDKYIKEHKLSSEMRITFSEDDNSTYIKDEKRIVMKSNADYLMVIIEGRTKFVNDLRKKINRLKVAGD